jgi:hypothetical protein
MAESRTVPPIVHFVWGLRPQDEAFPLLAYLAIASCRAVLGPERIVLHHHHLPWGLWWDLARPWLELRRVPLVAEVDTGPRPSYLVPERYRYAHHADFVRLDALLAEGGIYADLDTLFLAPLPEDLLTAEFVLGREPDVRHERTGELLPSLCNAFLLAAPGARFAAAWRAEMAAALDGTWSNHSTLLAQRLATRLPEAVRIEPEHRFYPVAPTPDGLARLFGPAPLELTGSVSVHLWSHLWWDDERRDFSPVAGSDLTPGHIRTVDTAFNRLARPYLPEVALP